jgi:hypothetical protein
MSAALRAMRLATGVWLVLVALWLTGCKTPDPENQSERPWATPRSWETGLPTSIMEGR